MTGSCSYRLALAASGPILLGVIVSALVGGVVLLVAHAVGCRVEGVANEGDRWA